MKQKSISTEQLVEMKQKAIGYSIIHLNDYPKNNTHFEAKLDIITGFEILYNADAYIIKYINGKGVLQKENMWAVFARVGYSNLFDYNKEFKRVEDAVAYVYAIHEKILDEEYKEEKRRLEEVKQMRLQNPIK